MDKVKVRLFIEANIIATHAYQVLLSAKVKGLAPELWGRGNLKESELQRLVQLQKKLLVISSAHKNKLFKKNTPGFYKNKELKELLASELYLAPCLPVNTWKTWLRKKAPLAPQLSLAAFASLLQMMLDINRDGEQLQELFRIYHALGLPVTLGQLGLRAKTNNEFLVFGRELSKVMCKSPFATDAKTLQMQFVKLDSWGKKLTGERDKYVLARELVKEKNIKILLPFLRKLPPQKLAVIGHSFSMNGHWSSPSSFIPVSIEILKKINSGVKIVQWERGGMSAPVAEKLFYKKVLKWRPDTVLFVIISEGEKNKPALNRMCRGFNKAGIKVLIFDNLWPSSFDFKNKRKDADFIKMKLSLVPLKKALQASPAKKDYVSLDGIHMTESWHRVATAAWLKYLAGTVA
ncbi:MAG: hypothetical protein WCK36_00595 [Candidatus Firestonebacteria bacterium]